MYEYGNTRLRAVRSRLLSKNKIEELAKSADLQTFINAVLKTRYRHALEEALSRVGGVRAINRSMRLVLSNLLGRLQEYYEGRAGELIDLILRRYDVENVKAILRGLQKRLSTDEIIQAFSAFGLMEDNNLMEIAQADRPREAIDHMASMQLAMAEPLLVQRAERPGAELFELELALERWYYGNAAQGLRSPKETEKALLTALEMAADMDNLMTILRFAHAPDQREILIEEFNLELSDLLLDFGDLSISQLQKVGEQSSVEEGIDVLGSSPYSEALNDGLEDYQRTSQLSAIERALRRQRLDWLQDQILADPLGMGVPIGVLALKMNEAANLRWIAWGLQIGLSPQEIREELEFPS
ncbi:MAG: V-type ATPase subunit [Anaerolineales bacterium]|jgi:vacuolar-type H+-ATPase subunit C/Vma6